MTKHIHIYQRIPSNHNLYRCIVKSCLGKFRKEDIRGKITLCHKCGKDTLMKGQNLNTALPRCEFCSNCKSAIEKRKIVEASAGVMGDLMSELFSEEKTESLSPSSGFDFVPPITLKDILGE